MIHKCTKVGTFSEPLRPLNTWFAEELIVQCLGTKPTISPARLVITSSQQTQCPVAMDSANVNHRLTNTHRLTAQCYQWVTSVTSADSSQSNDKSSLNVVQRDLTHDRHPRNTQNTTYSLCVVYSRHKKDCEIQQRIPVLKAHPARTSDGSLLPNPHSGWLPLLMPVASRDLTSQTGCGNKDHH